MPDSPRKKAADALETLFWIAVGIVCLWLILSAKADPNDFVDRMHAYP